PRQRGGADGRPRRALAGGYGDVREGQGQDHDGCRTALHGHKNILPVTIEAVKADMTIGDITKIYSQDPM
ncbi:MAG: hypothetical protein SVR08_07885, partial [Spirochaetota bacterium]|nr:hypothetical protein [Spirochaetota bacterium]